MSGGSHSHDLFQLSLIWKVVAQNAPIAKVSGNHGNQASPAGSAMGGVKENAQPE